MSEIITDRMLVLARKLNRGLSDVLDGCYARVSPDLRHLRLDKSGQTLFINQSRFKEMDDKSIVIMLEDDFKQKLERQRKRVCDER